MYILGVDPGQTGAWAVLDQDGNLKDSGKNNVFDPTIIRYDFDLCVIEKASARPGQGVVSMFKFGQTYGYWLGMFDALTIRYELVTPQKWQKEVLDFVPAKKPKRPNETQKEHNKRLAENRAALKEGIVNFVMRRWPETKDRFKLKKNWDIADAICIAEYGRRIQAL